MNTTEAVTRPDAWRAVRDGRSWRVLRSVHGCVEYHRGRSRYPAVRRGAIITFRIRDHAEARAGALNLADAKASQT